VKHPIALVLTLAFAAFPLFAQTAKSLANDADTLQDATYCELSRDPAAYNHKLVRLTALVTYGFEDFYITDPDCHTQGFSIWVMYGGIVQSGTMYCCPGEAASKRRPQPLTIEGIQIPLVEDATFKEFTGLLKREADTTVRLTAVGRFFSGEKQTINGQTRWGGAGHMGCCSLFVIQRAVSFESHTRSDVDYTSEAGWYEKEGCDYRSLKYLRHISIAYPDADLQKAIAEQHKADSMGGDWELDEPQRVAGDSLKTYYPNQIPVLRTVKKTPARYVFRWRNGKKQVIVVVTRPYWLSFYAKSSSFVWVSTTIKEASCD